MICSDCFPRARNKSYLQFTIPQMRAKTTSKKDSGREKDNVASCSREYRIKIQVLWFRSISWRPWLFPCIINRRYWIDISQPTAAEIRFNTIVHHPLTLQNYTPAPQPSHNCLRVPPPRLPQRRELSGLIIPRILSFTILLSSLSNYTLFFPGIHNVALLNAY